MNSAPLEARKELQNVVGLLAVGGLLLAGFAVSRLTSPETTVLSGWFDLLLDASFSG